MDTIRAEVTGRKPRGGAADEDLERIREPSQPGSFTISEWCRRHRLSVSFYYKMKAEGWGPRTMSAGARELIAVAADEQWVREREAAGAAGIRRALPDNSNEVVRSRIPSGRSQPSRTVLSEAAPPRTSPRKALASSPTAAMPL